jgi:hypothetical protein
VPRTTVRKRSAPAIERLVSALADKLDTLPPVERQGALARWKAIVTESEERAKRQRSHHLSAVL